MPARTLRRTVLGGLVAWTATLGGLRAFVVQPERCGDASPARLHAAAQLAVDWLAGNQRPDGSYLYRYDRVHDVDLGGYNIVRHAGVTMSLEQSAAAGLDGAAEAADRGLAWALDHRVVGPGWEALSDAAGPTVRVGATALLVAALAERRSRTDDREYDDLMRRLAAFLTTMVTEQGQVYGDWDRATATPVPDSWSPYFTGEVLWALAQLHRQLPAEGYDATARRIAGYLAAERDDVEGWWPDIADHWAAYGFAEMARWPDGFEPTPVEVRYMRRQAGFQSIQIRYESQRTNGWYSHVTRGRQTLGAGMGVIGEALDQWAAAARMLPGLDDLRQPLAERAACAAGVLAARQIGPDDVDEDDAPTARRATIGAWFQFGITQVDDQQHSLSALLGALALEEQA
jgi:hypothetical protein